MSTPEIRKALRRKSLWRVEDFATYFNLPHKTALRALQKYNRAVGGMLLRPSEGENRCYTFYWVTLAKHDPDAFLEDPIEQQARIDTLEDAADEMRRHMKIIAAQTGQNTRDIAKVRRTRDAA